MAISPSVRVNVTGARGESQADILRRTGRYGVVPTDTDDQAMGKLNAAAELAAATAESAAGPTYASVDDGIAATTSGHAFAVDNGNGTVTVYLNSAGVAVPQRTLATTAALAGPDGASMVGFKQDGPDAADRNILVKLQETVSVTDLEGVDPTGMTDSTDGFQAALDRGGLINVPDGVYRVRRRTPLGSYSTALRITQSDTRLVLSPRAILLLDAGQNCIVMRTAMAALGEVPSRLHNISIVGGGTVDGNWDQQTWLGPDGTAGGTVMGIDDQDGLQINEVDGVILDVNVRNCAQDGLIVASCTNIEVPGGSAKHCGKGGLTFFLCENYTVFGGDWEEPNDSPDGGVSKPYYTISSEGYAALGAAYAPNIAWSSGRNRGKFVAPNVKSRNGHGRPVSVINTLDLDVISPSIEVTGNRQAFTIGVQDAGVPGDTENINWIGGTITRTGQTSGFRIGSISSASTASLYSRNISINGVKVQTDGAFSSSLTLLEVKGKCAVSDINLTHGGGAGGVTIDARGCEDVGVIGGNITGRVSFNTLPTDSAVVTGLTMGGPIVGRSNVTTLKAGRNLGETDETNISHLRAGAGIAAGATETATITAAGVTPSDLIAWSTTAGGVEKVNVSVSPGTNQIILKLFNPTGTDAVVGSATWYFKAIKSGRNVM